MPPPVSVTAQGRVTPPGGPPLRQCARGVLRRRVRAGGTARRRAPHRLGRVGQRFIVTWWSCVGSPSTSPPRRLAVFSADRRRQGARQEVERLLDDRRLQPEARAEAACG